MSELQEYYNGVHDIMDTKEHCCICGGMMILSTHLNDNIITCEYFCSNSYNKEEEEVLHAVVMFNIKLCDVIDMDKKTLIKHLQSIIYLKTNERNGFIDKYECYKHHAKII
jgi:hypothetical protein